jgi:hypothetical protein
MALNTLRSGLQTGVQPGKELVLQTFFVDPGDIPVADDSINRYTEINRMQNSLIEAVGLMPVHHVAMPCA